MNSNKKSLKNTPPTDAEMDLLEDLTAQQIDRLLIAYKKLLVLLKARLFELRESQSSEKKTANDVNWKK